jgi:nanoRNase/pAp phosphatase (c-di-AMP/oligoRNAs hydrolase)
MKLDINMHLEEHKLSKDDLIYVSEIDPSKVDEVTLIDHNKLDATQEADLGKKVRRIIDHHVDTKHYDAQLEEK